MDAITHAPHHTLRKPMHWQALEYNHTEKSSDWFWALGLVVLAGIVGSLVVNNILLAVLLLVGGFALAVFAAREPDMVSFALTQRGVRIDDKLYPFKSLNAFHISEVHHEQTPKLILKPKSFIVPLIIVPLEGIEPDHVHDFLLDFLPDEEMHEPLTHHVMEWLGF